MSQPYPASAGAKSEQRRALRVAVIAVLLGALLALGTVMAGAHASVVRYRSSAYSQPGTWYSSSYDNMHYGVVWGGPSAATCYIWNTPSSGWDYVIDSGTCGGAGTDVSHSLWYGRSRCKLATGSPDYITCEYWR